MTRRVEDLTQTACQKLIPPLQFLHPPVINNDRSLMSVQLWVKIPPKYGHHLPEYTVVCEATFKAYRHCYDKCFLQWIQISLSGGNSLPDFNIPLGMFSNCRFVMASIITVVITVIYGALEISCREQYTQNGLIFSVFELSSLFLSCVIQYSAFYTHSRCGLVN